jgi:glycosyltransferase involved in cell wall biosynthesis
MIHVLLANKHYLGLAGGTERNISGLANWLAANGFRVSIVSQTRNGAEPAFPLNPRVDIIVPSGAATPPSSELLDPVGLRFLERADALEWAKRTLSMRQLWGTCIRSLDPDVILTFLPHTSTMLLQELGDEYPILVTNQNDPEVDYFSDKHGADGVDRQIRLESLDYAAAVHVLIPSFVEKVPPSARQRAIVIPNVVPPAHCDLGLPMVDRRKVIAVGRLVPQKGFDTLIDAFARVEGVHRGWQLHIFGQGVEESRLREQIRRRKLQRSVLLRGFTPDTPSQMRDADLFVIPSVYEGWGLTLTEAMSVGLPSIGFADCSGVNWLINDGRNGVLVERSAVNLAAAIDALLADRDLRTRLGREAKSFVTQFAPQKVYPMWGEAIRSLAGRGHP